jgi:hypothetical protein
LRELFGFGSLAGRCEAVAVRTVEVWLWSHEMAYEHKLKII